MNIAKSISSSVIVWVLFACEASVVQEFEFFPRVFSRQWPNIHLQGLIQSVDSLLCLKPNVALGLNFIRENSNFFPVGMCFINFFN